jgi:hypothetical protein
MISLVILGGLYSALVIITPLVEKIKGLSIAA